MHDASMTSLAQRRDATAPAATRQVAVRGSVMISARASLGRSRFEREELLARAAIGGREAKKMDRFALLAIGAARALLASLDERQRAECGFVCGNMMAGWSFTEPQLRALHARGVAEVSPYLASAWFPAAAQGQVAIHAGVRGYAKTFATDRCAGAQAIGHAQRRIAAGRAPRLLAGGVEAPVTPFVEAALRQSNHRVEDLAEAAALLLLAPCEGDGSAGDVVIRAHASFPLAHATGTSVTRRLAAIVERLAPPVPSLAVISTSPDAAQSVFARSIVQDVLDSRKTEIVFTTDIHGETLGASSALAAATAHERLASNDAAGGAALIFTLGHWSADALWLERMNN